MSTLQSQVARSLEGLTDDNLKFLLDMINRFMKPAVKENITASEESHVRPIGIFKDKKLYADGYDIDEENDEIAKMFGVM